MNCKIFNALSRQTAPVDYLYSADGAVYLNSQGNKVYYDTPADHAIRHQFSIEDNKDHMLTFSSGPMVWPSTILGQGLAHGAGVNYYGEDAGGSIHTVFGGVGKADPDGDFLIARVYKPSEGSPEVPTMHSNTMFRVWPDGGAVGPYTHATWTQADASDLIEVNSEVDCGHEDYPWQNVNALKSITHGNTEYFGQTSNIIDATVYQNSDYESAGYQLVRVSYYMYITGTGTGGALDLNILWHDGAGSRTHGATQLDCTNPEYCAGSFLAMLSPGVPSGNYQGSKVRATTTLTGESGTPEYALVITAEVLHRYTP